ncbi:hypothetical protein SAMN05444411_102485 [Lutibacter oricola]|uniref:Sugar transporter n=1 Tax=Lutibacter oricola TaxID=762486 RepID=A0A1H2XJG9_9FLAO|nr:hypothetical protein [Lutibacter oricola]SDW92848.1 hypothetical protein SAMN05444411_102485 [Lutibacter oricola]
MTTLRNKPTILFWIISIVALIWNILGVMQYLAQAYMTPEAKALLPEGDQAYFNNLPVWVTAAFAIAVFSGTIGCLALVLRKKWATPLLFISLICVIAQVVYNLFIQKYIDLEGARMAMPIVILIIALYLVFFSIKSTKQKYLV